MTLTDTAPPRAVDPSRTLALVSLTKPRVVAANGALILVGAASTGAVALHTLLPAMLGGLLVIASAAAGNQWFERDVDARMDRTRTRPLPAGTLPAHTALLASAALLAAGLAVLALHSSPPALAWAATGWVLYTLLYTPAKRWSPTSLHLGALSGAVTPLLGAYASSPHPGATPWAIALFVLLWQYPHFMAIGLRRRSEYRASGLAVYTARHTARRCVNLARASATALLAAGLLVPGPNLMAVWVVSALPLVIMSLRNPAGRLDPWARELFLASLWSMLLFGTGVLVTWFFGAGA